jgi:hypothetical protein
MTPTQRTDGGQGGTRAEAAYSQGEPVPLRGYAGLAAVYAGGLGAFALWCRRTGRRLPDGLPLRDLALIAVATHKASRLLAKDKITSFVRAPFTRRERAETASEVTDVPHGRGVRLAVGELLACPFCLAAWVAGGLVCGTVAAPRVTRLATGGLAAVAASDWLQYAWSATQQSAEG